MSEQQGLEITPIIEPSNMIGIFVSAIVIAAPILILMALLVLLKKWVDKKLGALTTRKQNKIPLGKWPSDWKPQTVDRFEENASSAGLTFYPRDIFTAAEFKFFLVLQNVCRNYFYIIPKMGLWALVDHRDNVTAWNKISRKHLDFTLCHPQTMKPLLVIELDDSSHRQYKQQQRDAEKDAILAEVGVPVLRIPVARQYDEGAIKNLISRKMKQN